MFVVSIKEEDTIQGDAYHLIKESLGSLLQSGVDGVLGSHFIGKTLGQQDGFFVSPSATACVR